MEKYTKLVRDNIPEVLSRENIPHEVKNVSPEEYRRALIDKLQEETQEFFEDPTVEELADVEEVLIHLKSLPEYKNIDDVREKKKAEKGGFGKGFVVTGYKK